MRAGRDSDYGRSNPWGATQYDRRSPFPAFLQQPRAGLSIPVVYRSFQRRLNILRITEIFNIGNIIYRKLRQNRKNDTLEVVILPFLDKKTAQTGVIVKQRAPDEKPEESQGDDSGIHACAEDLIHAIHNKDIKAAAEAIKAAFEILDAQPHEEGPHVEPHSYDSQNQKAGE